MGDRARYTTSGGVSVEQVGEAIIRKAVRAESSDVQIIPCNGYSLIRFRVNGEFSEPVKIPRDLHDQVLHYFQNLAASTYGNVDLNQAFQIKMADSLYSIDIETGQTSHGESISVRINPVSSVPADLTSTGMLPALSQQVCKAVASPSGVVVVSGPAGSGKTHTMYALLQYLAAQGKRVIAVEEKVEIELSGILQIEHSCASGEMCLDDVLLQRIRNEHADVVMLAGMMDAKYVRILFELAQEGVLVLLRLQANDAASTLSYLMSLDLDKGVLAQELRMIINQRLMRALCSQCGEETLPDMDLLMRLDLDSDTRVYRTSGCASCMQTGYTGHLAVHEVMAINETLASMIREHASDQEMCQASRQAGMDSLFEDGLSKALAGRLSMNDLLRELPKPIALDEPPTQHTYKRSSETSFSFHQRSVEALKRMQEVSSSGEHPSLLLVEDSTTMRDYISYILRRGGHFDVVDVETAEEGLSIILQEKPSVIVTDQVLPGMNGTSFIATIRSNPKLSDIPIVLLTSEEKMEIEALRTGADGYIEKPVDPDLLLARVNAVFSAYQRMRQSV